MNKKFLIFQLLKIFLIIKILIFSHEKPTDPDDPLSHQNMRDRYYGTKDPVAEKLLNRAKAMPKLTPPEDITVTTLYIGNLGQDNHLIVDEKDLRFNFLFF